MSWVEYKIKDVINHFQNGYAFKASKYTDSGIPIISMQSISLNGEFQLSEKNNCWDSKEKEKLKNFILKKGDLIMSMTDVTPQRNLIGCSTIINREGIFFLNQRVGKLEPNSIIVDVNFLDFYFKSNHWRNYCRRISSLSVQANIGTRDILNGKIKLPPKLEQTAIATILSKVDEAIEATRQSIKAAEKLKKALMQNLLTGKLKPDGTWRTDDEFYEDEKFGKVPVGWEVKKLKDVYDDLIMGQSPSSLTYNDEKKGLPFVQGNADMKNGVPKIRIYTTDPKKISKQGDLLLSVRAPVGDLFKNNIVEIAIGRGISAIRIKNKFMSKYIFYYFSWDKKQFFTLQQGTTFTEIGKREVRNLKIAFSNNSNEIEKIVLILSNVDNELQSKQTKIKTLQRLKKSLMQNLLTGKIRLDMEAINKIINEQNNG